MVGLRAMVGVEDQAVGRDGGGGVGMVAEEGGKAEALVCPHLLPAHDEESVRGILKEAALRAIHDIEIEFTSEALKNNYNVGSTATIAMLLDGRILVANVGDLKVLLCSNRSKGSSRTLYAEELTRDHHPDRANERA
ncbi:hypothetical protein RJ639_028480 [Escallonia herrerae]|uniref:PPM-type phosphatase domain-containing protein n=1 Tax=Escallonia herrerae TaxID=1293975 RepID=A0AA89BGA4_9ASTE|nr:hypothetical protein RJ639_028480 [Escallonia herrerae]